MKRLSCLLALALFGAIQSAWAETSNVPGVRAITAPAPQRGRALDVLIWYPAKEGGAPELIGDNALFRGTRAVRDAPMQDGRHPLVLLSHGSGGSAATLGWIASRLAGAGFLVAAPNHPGTTTGDSSPAATIRIWERPADLAAVLSALQEDPALGNRIDPRRIGVLGFSLGGHTALALVGVRADAQAYRRYCDLNKELMSECAWFARGGLDLAGIETARFEQSSRDPRVMAAVAVDPGLVQAFVLESLAAIDASISIINLGRSGTIPLAVEASAVARLMPRATYETVPDAIHFSFLGECKPEGRATLAAEGETDPLCEDAGGRSREVLHEELAGMIVSAFQRHLGTEPSRP